MSWSTLLAIAAGAYLFKAAGSFGLGRLANTPAVLGIGGLLPPALLAGLIVIQTFSTDASLVLDERAAGVTIGAIAAWRGAPFWLVALIAAVVTGILRAIF